jgi:hypothetical protein
MFGGPIQTVSKYLGKESIRLILDRKIETTDFTDCTDNE